MRRWLAALAVLLALVSCRESSRKALLGDPCAKIVLRFEHEISSAANVCSNDLGCACYASISDEIAPCGAVIDVKTAERLQAIASEFHAANCTKRALCAPRLCEPHCVRGHCQ
jgi:hypothetical protein